MVKNDDENYRKSALWFSNNQDMRLDEAMLAAGFTGEEAKDTTIQKRVRRRPEYKIVKEKKATLPLLNNNINNININIAEESSPPLSPLTAPSFSISKPSIDGSSAPASKSSSNKIRMLRLTLSQKQKDRV
jgi:hypothetical protein